MKKKKAEIWLWKKTHKIPYGKRKANEDGNRTIIKRSNKKKKRETATIRRSSKERTNPEITAEQESVKEKYQEQYST